MNSYCAYLKAMLGNRAACICWKIRNILKSLNVRGACDMAMHSTVPRATKGCEHTHGRSLHLGPIIGNDR